jgi:FAD-dependent urate hydroxylase
VEAFDVAVVGAGPFGLSAAAHLREIKGLEMRIFGQPMCFWERCMPPQMLLRSHWHATHIADPKDELTLDAYRFAGNRGLAEPIPVAEFIKYGRWFHVRSGIGSDYRKVVGIDLAGNGYRLTLEDGETAAAKRVLVAIGIERFAYKPDMFHRVPRELVSHSSELRDYRGFKEKEVIVIGGGQSALESAAFLHEGGAHVELLVRAPAQCARKSWYRKRINPKWLKVLHGRGGVGPAGISLIIQRPSFFGRFPRRLQTAWDRRATKLGFSYRLVPNMNGTPIGSGQSVDRVRVEGERLRLWLSDENERVVDHVVLATGYRVNVARYGLFTRQILDRLTLVDGYPRLDSGLESSVPGLHFLGAPAAYSFGPLMRFVAGTPFAASAVTRRIRRKHRAA